MFRFSKTSNKRRAGVDSRLIQISDRALEISVVDFGIPNHGGIRTVEEQYRLFLDGKDRKSTRLNSSHLRRSRMPSSA